MTTPTAAPNSPNAAPAALSRHDRLQIALAWAGWAVLTVVIVVMVIKDPIGHSVTYNYRRAAYDMLAGRSMYTEGQHGWLYLPNTAALYVPFTLGPAWLGESLFRIAISAIYALGLWKIAVLASPRRAGDYFPVMTLAAMPLAYGSIRNGQMNIPLGGAMAMATAFLAQSAWWRAGASLAFGVLCKPIGIVMALLAVPLRPRVILPLTLCVAASLALPFLKPDWPYIADQYRLGLAKVLEAGEPGAGVFADLGGMLLHFGIKAPEPLMLAARAVFALATLGLSWLALRRCRPVDGWVLVLALASCYLMLFNPRTEGVSYPILMPALGAVTCWAIFRDRNRWLGALLLTLCVVMAGAHIVSRTGTDMVWRPMGAAVFGCICVFLIRRGAAATG